jgi:hypothetical protein
LCQHVAALENGNPDNSSTYVPIFIKSQIYPKLQATNLMGTFRLARAPGNFEAGNQTYLFPILADFRFVTTPTSKDQILRKR